MRANGSRRTKFLASSSRKPVGTECACVAQPISAFDGTWVFQFHGQPIFKLTLATAGGHIQGSLIRRKNMTVDQDGDVSGVGGVQVTLPLRKARRNAENLEFVIDGEPFVMTIEDHDHASLVLTGMRPFRLERVADGSAVVLPTKLVEPEYPPAIRALREQLHAMVKEDQQARMAFNDQRIEAVDAKNQPQVLHIFEQYGGVTISLAGTDASHDYWLLVQHQTPEIQQRLLPALEKAAKNGDASMSAYAYLYDRVQVGLGKPQHWGSQTKCENGKPVLSPVDDPAGLDARRKELFLMPIDDYLRMPYIVKTCKSAK